MKAIFRKVAGVSEWYSHWTCITGFVARLDCGHVRRIDFLKPWGKRIRCTADVVGIKAQCRECEKRNGE